MGLPLRHMSVLSDQFLAGRTKDWTVYLSLGHIMDIRRPDRAGRWDGQRQRYESGRVANCRLPVLMMLRSRVPRGGVQALQGRGGRSTHYGSVTRGDKPSVYPVALFSSLVLTTNYLCSRHRLLRRHLRPLDRAARRLRIVRPHSNPWLPGPR